TPQRESVRPSPPRTRSKPASANSRSDRAIAAAGDRTSRRRSEAIEQSWQGPAADWSLAGVLARRQLFADFMSLVRVAPAGSPSGDERQALGNFPFGNFPF